MGVAIGGRPLLPSSCLGSCQPHPRRGCPEPSHVCVCVCVCMVGHVQSMTGQVAEAPARLKRICPGGKRGGVVSLQPGPGSALLTSVVATALTDTLLDDIVLTHSLFLPTEKFLQELHQ